MFKMEFEKHCCMFEEIEINTDCNVVSYEYKNINKIDTVDYRKISYDSFFHSYIAKNYPCLITNVSDTWNCTIKWTQNKEINYNYLSETYKNETVPVADCAKITFDSQKKEDVKFDTYMQYLSSTSTLPEETKKILYLKDWHLRRTLPNDQFYEVPSLFASDWLNEYAIDNKEDDYMFVYIGPKKSMYVKFMEFYCRTPLHADVYSSYSWSVNVIGRKKWILFPPGEESKLKNALGNLPLLYDKNILGKVRYFEVIQDKSDAIFVPSGWHHQVENLIETISINHNWINGCNIQFVWKALLESLNSVEEEISDLRETPEYSSQCQIILKSLFGMDFESFAIFLIYIGKKRLTEFNSDPRLKFNKFYLGKNHILFDLKSLFKIINDIIHHPNYFEKCANKQLETDLNIVKLSISNKLNLS